MKKLLTLFVTTALATCAPHTSSRPATPAVPPSPIDTTGIRSHTRFLSDDALAGRATGTKEADVAALYIQSACMAIGFGPVAARSYFQPVSLDRTTINPSGTNLVLSDPRGSRTFEYRSGFVPNAGFDETNAFTGRAVLVGTSEEVAAGRLRGLDIRGAVAVIGGPLDDAVDDTLRGRGVSGVIQLTTDERQYLLYVRSRGDSRLQLADPTARQSLEASQPSIVASPRLSREILSDGPTQGPSWLRDSVTVTLNLDRQRVSSNNVACLLQGTDPKLRDTAIAFSAHYDHLGVGVPDARGDSIYNGFSDNAAGVAMLLAIGEAMAGRPGGRPRRSILLLFFTGEEQGLLGSDYYVAKPLWPLERTRAVINLDAGAPPARPWSWRIAGGDSPLGQLARDVAADHGWSATTSPATPNSDYFPFVRSGVPAIFIVPGSAPYQGLSADSSQALRRRWDHYHEPADHWSPDFPFAGLGRYAEFAYYIGRALDGEPAGLRRRAPPGL